MKAREEWLYLLKSPLAWGNRAAFAIKDTWVRRKTNSVSFMVKDHLRWIAETVRGDFRRLLGRCEHCGASPAKLTSGRTCYHHEPSIWTRDPNRDLYLCDACAKEHHDYWDEMWSEYYRDRF